MPRNRKRLEMAQSLWLLDDCVPWRVLAGLGKLHRGRAIFLKYRLVNEQ